VEGMELFLCLDTIILHTVGIWFGGRFAWQGQAADLPEKDLSLTPEVSFPGK